MCLFVELFFFYTFLHHFAQTNAAGTWLMVVFPYNFVIYYTWSFSYVCCCCWWWCFFIMIYCKLSNTYNTKEDSFYISCKGGWKPFRAYGSPLQCCRKCQNPESSIGLPMVVVWWSASVLGRPSIKDLLRPWNQLKMTNISAAANEESWVTQRTTQLMVYVGCSTQILGGPT